MKRLILILLGTILLAAGAFVAAMNIDVRRAALPEEDAAPVRIAVERGASFGRVVGQLHDAGLVAHPRVLRLYARLTRSARSIHTGTYEFNGAQRPLDMLRALVSGDVLRVGVTVPEGYTMWEIAGAFQVAGIDSTLMLAAIAAEDVREKRRIEAPSLEGYLFPDTYVVPYGAHAREAVAMMLDRMDAVFGAAIVERAVHVGMTPHDVLTMASIVEAETRVPAERPTVAAVYHNRIARGMRLEADPTVAYAMGGYRGRLVYADLEIKSPYNTYRNKGLPLGPICSPGAAAIQAALYPDSSEQALYFVARGDGSHIFSHTLQEHLSAVRKVRAARKGR